MVMIEGKTKYLVSTVLCVLLSQAACFATDYYVDASAGNDVNSGRSTTTPWRTLAKVNSYTGFAAGDRILLQRGRTWREQLTVPRSGVSGSPIVFGAYGTGNKPMLKGSALVTNWGSAGSNRWSASLGAAPNQVFFNGVRGTKKGGTSSLTAARDWYWSSGALYVYSASNPDSAYTGGGIEASVRPSTRTFGIIHMAGREYVTIQDIDVSQSASYGIYIRPTSRYITVRGCDVGHSLDGGIVASTGSTPSTQITVENCSVHHNNGGFKEGAPGVATYHEGLTMEGIDGFTIRGVQVYANYMEGVNFKRGARNGVIENSLLYANALINQYIEGATNIQIRYNKIYDCTYNAGIEFGLETNTYSNDAIKIYDNLFWGNSGGISFWSSSVTAQTKNISIYNNTFFNNWEAIRWKSGATDNYSGANYIKNNLIWQNSTSNWAIRDYTSGRQALSRTTVAYNAFQQGAATDTTGSSAKVISNPYFVNAGSRDFHLGNSSPCINAGTSVGLTRDFDGAAVPQGSGPDLGAYEYGSGAATGYALTISAANGTVTKSPNQTSYASGTSVSLQATPNGGYRFTGWSGDLTGTTNPATLVMNSNKSVTANFAASTGSTTYTLTVSATNGTVTRTPNQSSYTSGTSVSLQAMPNSGYTFTGWSGALTGTANPATLVMNSNKSVTANFAASTGGTTTKKVGNTTVFSGSTSLQIRRAVPYTMAETGQLRSITIYHEAGSGQMLLAVYADSSGKPGARLGATNSTTVSSAAGWQTVALQSPVSVSAGQKIWLAWVFQNAVVIHATEGTPGRADSTVGWSSGMPTTFGTSTVGNYIYSIYATYTPASAGGGTSTTSGTVGTTTVLSSITKDTNRRAMAYTAPGAGQLQSMSIYHQAGSGQMILGVY
ncbi:MAG: right-handed parallel beta-helix repeat-containing protein, partial [Planctomycetaceae bacterium]